MTEAEKRFKKLIKEDDQIHELSKDKKSYIIVRNDGTVERYEFNEKIEDAEDRIGLDEAWDAFDKFIEIVGEKEALNAIGAAMGHYELADYMEYLYRIYDIPYSEFRNEEPEEEE